MLPAWARELLALQVGIDARHTWRAMGPDGFADVQELVAALDEADRHGEPLASVAAGSTGYYDFTIVHHRTVLAAVSYAPAGLILFALGRPVVALP